MDRDFSWLERRYTQTPGRDAGLELAQAALRAGRVALALELARAFGERDLQAQAGRRLAELHNLSFLGLTGSFERFSSGDWELVLVPGGAYLDEGPTAWSSSLLPGSERAALQHRVIPNLLVGVRALSVGSLQEATQLASLAGGRLPTPSEWKKCWRGGLFLAGDRSEGLPHPRPDQIGPWGNNDPPETNQPARSPYGLEFQLGAWECSEGRPPQGMGYLTGRYQVSLERPEDRRGRALVWRLVREL